MTKRLLASIGLDDEHRHGKSWDEPVTNEQMLRAQSALGSIEIDVLMGKKDEAEITATAALLLRGVNRIRWADA